MPKGNPSPSHKFEKGNTIAKDSGNMKRKRIRKSPLRKTLAKLQELEPYALALIEKSVKEQQVDKESLSTSKWVVTNLMTLTRSAIQEEDVINGLRLKLDEAEAEEEKESEDQVTPTPAALFSLVVPEKNKE